MLIPVALFSLDNEQKDPYFLYTLDVNEADFHALKKEQSLLVDFAAFPSKFIELLEQCLLSYQRNEDPSKYADARHCNSNQCLRFILTLLLAPSGSAALSVVEVNNFRNLPHLAIRLSQGNDALVKKRLAERCVEWKVS